MSEMRLQKYLSEAGVASRRKSEEMIKQGRVSVNGQVVAEMGVKVSDNDVVEVDGKIMAQVLRKLYIILNKPVGYISSVKDQFSRPTVIDLLPEISERVYPVGRLDYDTSGLILLTNDGEFSYKLTHPSHEINKVYEAEVKGVFSRNDIASFENGIEIDGYITSPAGICTLKSNDNTSFVEITIHEGRNRQVRKMCEAVKHPVVRLKRIALGGVKLDGLQEGKWRFLDSEEVNSLMEGASRK